MFPIEGQGPMYADDICIIADSHEEIIICDMAGFFTISAFIKKIPAIYDAGASVDMIRSLLNIYIGIFGSSISTCLA